MTEQTGNDARKDIVTAKYVDLGVSICITQGAYPALLIMEKAGVPHSIALRVLCSPEHFRKRDRRMSVRLRG